MKNRNKSMKTAAILIGLSIVLAGCAATPEKESSPKPTSSATKTASPTPEPTATENAGGVDELVDVTVIPDFAAETLNGIPADWTIISDNAEIVIVSSPTFDPAFLKSFVELKVSEGFKLNADSVTETEVAYGAVLIKGNIALAVIGSADALMDGTNIPISTITFNKAS